MEKFDKLLHFITNYKNKDFKSDVEMEPEFKDWKENDFISCCNIFLEIVPKENDFAELRFLVKIQKKYCEAKTGKYFSTLLGRNVCIDFSLPKKFADVKKILLSDNDDFYRKIKFEPNDLFFNPFLKQKFSHKNCSSCFSKSYNWFFNKVLKNIIENNKGLVSSTLQEDSISHKKLLELEKCFNEEYRKLGEDIALTEKRKKTEQGQAAAKISPVKLLMK